MDRREAIQALMSLPATARIRVARLQPEDVIVIECDEHISWESADKIKGMVEQVWPGRKCAVLSGGLKMKVTQG